MNALEGPAVTLYDGNGISRGWRDARPLLERARPPLVQLHCWPSAAARKVADEVRAQTGARVLFGCGVDGIARKVAAGSWPVERAVAQFVAIARGVVDAGALVVVWNAETYWKAPAGSAKRALLERVVREALAAVAAACPTLVQAFTSFDHPTYHGDFPWRAWLGDGSPIALALPQVYAAPGGDVMAHRGALPAREARALASWAAAVRAHWFNADDPATPAVEGPAWRPYYQLHHVAMADTVAGAVAHPLACLWAAPTRCDDAGRRAVLALCELWRRGLWGEGAVARFQAGAGLSPDGVCGPLTLTALGVE